MPTLLISIPGQPSREINLERGHYRIGRETGNALIVEARAVSQVASFILPVL